MELTDGVNQRSVPSTELRIPMELILDIASIALTKALEDLANYSSYSWDDHHICQPALIAHPLRSTTQLYTIIASKLAAVAKPLRDHVLKRIEYDRDIVFSAERKALLAWNGHQAPCLSGEVKERAGDYNACICSFSHLYKSDSYCPTFWKYAKIAFKLRSEVEKAWKMLTGQWHECVLEGDKTIFDMF